MLNFIGIIAVIAYLNFWLLLPTFLLAIIFVILRRFYLASARDIKRLEGISKWSEIVWVTKKMDEIVVYFSSTDC